MSVLQIMCILYGWKKPPQKRPVQLETGDPDVDDFEPSPPKSPYPGGEPQLPPGPSTQSRPSPPGSKAVGWYCRHK